MSSTIGRENTATASPSASPPGFLDPEKSLACIHCGLCLGSCPTYLETGDENDSPRGRIYLMRAVNEGRLPLGGAAVRHIDLCLGCRACEAACPSGVQYGALLEHTRDHIEAHHRRPLRERFLRRLLIEQVFPFPERLQLALAPVRLARLIGLHRWGPRFLREALALVPRELPRIELPAFAPAAGSEFKIQNSKFKIPSPEPGTQNPEPAPKRARAGFVSGCAMSVMFGRTNANSVRLLSEAGFEVATPRDQGCCGALHAHSGQLNAARECARRNIEAFERAKVDVVIINAAGCGSTLKEYGALLADDPAWAGRAASFGRKVKDLTEVLSPRNFAPPPPSPATRVTYHDACHLCHAQRIAKQPRDLVRAVAGKNYVELPEADVCCGSAGTYNLTEPAMAARLQRRKIDNILASGAQVVVSTNPGCLLQIQAGLEAAGANDVRTLHIADYLAESGDRD